ncbi:MAG: hypothetical protein AVDCRST_MAG50-2500 [uncultured Acidimicrobiales bacterium]|uniref:Uncharacterized protein n=1 Tax=uncultured Acidimicrobiales bacterium TaxID=310071 RepID=A0A6J4ID97_9ACTN|nr:MAG: hypothetical protein AVDCRST_MAG50-2500 [uncultured Acidimicrobiales bacterium]
MPTGRRIGVAGTLRSTGQTGSVFPVDDLLPLLVLALGGALLVGNALALVRPPDAPREGELGRAPAGRTVTMLLVGLVATVWAVASLTT